ncbi:unnamed protein product, partial [marine sediment metagenome]
MKLTKLKSKRLNDKTKKVKGVSVSLAILGGGDVAFPLIFAGVVLRAFSFTHAIV